MRKSHPLFLLALCLFTSPLFAQKEFNTWKSIDCYPGLEYSLKRSTGNGNKESHELSVKFRHHYEKAIAFSYTIKDSGGKSTLGSGNISLDAGDDKTIQFNLSDSENLRVIITNFRLGGEGGDMIPCGANSDDSEKKKDGDEKTDDKDKKEKKNEIEAPAIVPAGGVASTAVMIGEGDKNEGGRKEGQEKESEDKKSGGQEEKTNQTEGSEKKTESIENTGIKEKETAGGKPEEGAKGQEGERKEGEGKEGERKEEERTGNESAIKEKESEGENKEGEKKEGEEKEQFEQEKEKQVTSPVVPTGETENKGALEPQPVKVKENKQAEQSNEVTNPPTEEKQIQPVEKTVEKSKEEETPVVVPVTTEKKTQEEEPVKTEEKPKPAVDPTTKPEPTVTPIETPVKESKTEESAPVNETKAKEVPEPVVEEKEVKEAETSEGETVEGAEEEKSLPEEEKGEEGGEAKEGGGEGEAEQEEETNDDLKRRIEEGNQRQQEADASQNQMASQLGDILSAEGGGDVYTRLAIGMNLEGGLAVQAVPMVENASSSTGAITPYSASTLPINIGIYARPELWLLRNQYFGLGVDYRVIITYSVLAGGGISSTALASGGNLRFQAGLKHFKLHFQAGKENRNGTYSNDHDVTNNALGSSTNNSVYSDGDYNYQVTNTGFGALIDFRDYNNKEAFIKYTLSYERPDFLPAANAAIKTHTIHVRYFLDIIFTYGNKYPIAGKPSYTYLTSDKNKDYFFFGLGKTFKIFKSK